MDKDEVRLTSKTVTALRHSSGTLVSAIHLQTTPTDAVSLQIAGMDSLFTIDSAAFCKTMAFEDKV